MVKQVIPVLTDDLDGVEYTIGLWAAAAP